MEAKKQNLVELDRGLPGRVPILTSSVAVTVTEQCRWISNPRRLIGIGALPTLIEGSLIEFACSGSTDEPTLSAAREFATTIGKESALAQDSVGLVTPRILCMLVNEAYFAMKEGVAAGRDIDLAMRLGTNYPYGPVEWADRIGIRQVHAIVSALYRSFGEDRYRVAPLLQVTADRAALANA
jgi:3-hydroxybutyryl-CoA dehydrogenase